LFHFFTYLLKSNFHGLNKGFAFIPNGDFFEDFITFEFDFII